MGEVAVVLHSLQGQLTAEGGAGTGQHVVEDVVVPVGQRGGEGRGGEGRGGEARGRSDECLYCTTNFQQWCMSVV